MHNIKLEAVTAKLGKPLVSSLDTGCNLNMIQGELRHMDWSTASGTITKGMLSILKVRLTNKQLPPTTSLVVGNNSKVFFIGS